MHPKSFDMFFNTQPKRGTIHCYKQRNTRIQQTSNINRKPWLGEYTNNQIANMCMNQLLPVDPQASNLGRTITHNAITHDTLRLKPCASRFTAYAFFTNRSAASARRASTICLPRPLTSIMVLRSDQDGIGRCLQTPQVSPASYGSSTLPSGTTPPTS